MDFLIYTLGTTGDLLPFLSIARELNARGHQTILLSNEKFAPLARSFGIEFTSISSYESYRKTYDNTLTWSPLHSQNHYNQFHFPAIKPTFEFIRNIVSEGRRPFVIFQDALSGAGMACREFDLAYCHIFLAPHGIYSELDPAFPLRRHVPESLWRTIIPQLRTKSIKDSFEKVIRPLVNPLREEMGLSAWSIEDMPMTEDSRYLLSLFPAWLKPRPADWPTSMMTSGFILNDIVEAKHAKVIEDFIATNGQPITFSFGTGIPVTRQLIEKLRKICRKIRCPGILVSSGQLEQVLPDADGPLLVSPTAEFSVLFPLSRLVVHHGGIGTCAQALAAGVPQLISPYAFDQPDNAFLIWQLGVGNSINFSTSSVEEICTVINDLIACKTTNENCKKCAEKTNDSTIESVDHIIHFASGAIN